MQVTGYPELYLEIGRLETVKPQDTLNLLKTYFSGQFPNISQEKIGVGVDKLDATVLHGVNGSKASSPAFYAAAFSDGKAGSFYYIIHYFLEAAEGINSRFNQYLDTFKIS